MPARRPFDPRRVRTPVEERLAPAVEGALSVRAVNELIRGAIDRTLPTTLHVLGEIGNLSRPASGHLYFTLKDAESELRCVMWRSTAAKLKFAPEGGLEVVATGAIEVYVPRGSYQLMVRKLEPRGMGALELAFRQLKEKLEKEGLFDSVRKQPLPRIPERIAIVTSPSGAAIRDIVQTLRRRFPVAELLVFPVRVQGDGAAGEIAAAIRQMNASRAELNIDVAIVGRGGGSLEDLWAFNEEVVARAIAASQIPIISAVGHEIDVSISDLVADVRAATPTAAAELVAPAQSELRDWVDARVTRAARRVRHDCDLARAELATLLAYDGLAKPLRRVHDAAQRLDELLQRGTSSLAARGHHARQAIGGAELAILRFGSGVRFARLGQRLQQREHLLQRALARILRRAERKLDLRERRVEHASPQRSLPCLREHASVARQRLDSASQRLIHYGRRLLSARLEAVHACDPRSVLKRGYAITREAKSRRVLRSIAEVRDKLRIIVELQDGEFRGTADDPRQPGLWDE